MYNIRVLQVDNLIEAKKEIALVGADDMGLKLMTPKAIFRVIKIEDVPGYIANIIKQEMLSKGGEAAVSRAVGRNLDENTDILLMGTVKQYKELACKLKLQPFKLPKLADKIMDVLNNIEPIKPFDLKCRDYSLRIGERTLIMGILNVTPDSFSDGGRFFDFDRAVEHAHEMVEQGADIIDIGAESTRPTSTPITAEEELERLMPVLEKLVKEINVPISVDTYKAQVAREAMKAGAHILNDVWGLKFDPEIAEVAAEYDVPLILMHNQKGTQYKNLMEDIIASLAESVRIAEEAGVKPENIVLDPGIGFGKNYEQNLTVMKHLKELKTLGKPILLGTSRKSMIGNTLDLPPDDRVEGTCATVALGITLGADIVRVHDVKEMVRVAKMTDAMVRR